METADVDYPDALSEIVQAALHLLAACERLRGTTAWDAVAIGYHGLRLAVATWASPEDPDGEPV